ncbi:MAG: molecular chaperone GrpE [Myxococcota bacterium]|jgi:molecular chaperone GrpE
MSTEEERDAAASAEASPTTDASEADIVDAEEIIEDEGGEVIDLAEALADVASSSDDEVFEGEVIDPLVISLQIELGGLQAKVEQISQEKQELVARLRTVSAAYKQQQEDVSATRARLERIAKEKEEIRRGEVVSSLFEPLQNLLRAKDGMEKAEIDAGHIQGVEMVIRQIQSAFEALGMEEVPGKGAKFDPNLHEALTMMPVQDPALHEAVVEVFETGYRIGSRLIRPARVIVGKYTAPEEPVAEA